MSMDVSMLGFGGGLVAFSSGIFLPVRAGYGRSGQDTGLISAACRCPTYAAQGGELRAQDAVD